MEESLVFFILPIAFVIMTIWPLTDEWIEEKNEHWNENWWADKSND